MIDGDIMIESVVMLAAGRWSDEFEFSGALVKAICVSICLSTMIYSANCYRNFKELSIYSLCIVRQFMAVE